MWVPLILSIFGLIGLLKGEFKVTAGRKVSGLIGRILGILMLIGAGLTFFVEQGALVALGVLLFVIVAALIMSEKVEEKGMQSEAPERERSKLSTRQVAILAVLLVGNCLILGVAGKLLLDRWGPFARNPVAAAPQASQAAFTPVATPTLTPVPTPTLEPGWVLHEKAGDGYAVPLPAAWVELDLTAETMEAALAPCREYDPQATFPSMEERDLKDLVSKGVILIALDMGSKDRETGPHASINVGRLFVGQATSLDEAVQSVSKEFLDNNIKMQYHRVNLPLGEAEEMRWLAADSVDNTFSVQYLMVHGEYWYLISFGTDAELAEQYEPVFRQIMHGFSFLD